MRKQTWRNESVVLTFLTAETSVNSEVSGNGTRYPRKAQHKRKSLEIKYCCPPRNKLAQLLPMVFDVGWTLKLLKMNERRVDKYLQLS